MSEIPKTPLLSFVESRLGDLVREMSDERFADDPFWERTDTRADDLHLYGIAQMLGHKVGESVVRYANDAREYGGDVPHVLIALVGYALERAAETSFSTTLNLDGPQNDTTPDARVSRVGSSALARVLYCGRAAREGEEKAWDAANDMSLLHQFLQHALYSHAGLLAREEVTPENVGKVYGLLIGDLSDAFAQGLDNGTVACEYDTTFPEGHEDRLTSLAIPLLQSYLTFGCPLLDPKSEMTEGCRVIGLVAHLLGMCMYRIGSASTSEEMSDAEISELWSAVNEPLRRAFDLGRKDHLAENTDA